MYQYLSAQVAIEFEEATRTEDLVLDTELRLRQWHLASQRRAMARQRVGGAPKVEKAVLPVVKSSNDWLESSELDERKAPRRQAAREKQLERQRQCMARLRAARALVDEASVEELRGILARLRCGIFHGAAAVFVATARNHSGL